jgi:hypothetical protein
LIRSAVHQRTAAERAGDAAELINGHGAIHEVTIIRLWEVERFMSSTKRLKISWKIKIQL